MRKYKAIYFLLFVITSIEFLSGQNTENTEENKIDTPQRAMIYPGCEKYKDNNRELYSCFNENFKRELERHLPILKMNFDEPKVLVKLVFSIEKNGYIQLNESHSDDVSGKYEAFAVEGFRSLANKLNSLVDKNKGIKPAIGYDESPVIMEYTVPLTFTPPEKTKRQLRKEMKRKRNLSN